MTQDWRRSQAFRNTSGAGAASIGESGFCAAILVDTDAGIPAGHGRLMAARMLWLTSSTRRFTGQILMRRARAGLMEAGTSRCRELGCSSILRGSTLCPFRLLVGQVTRFNLRPSVTEW
jgi:hypothetical protein